MIKGRSKIQLFNAKTGKIEAEQVNDNIVTNAVQDILNYSDPLKQGTILRSLGYNSNGQNFTYEGAVHQLSYLTPYSTAAYGGLLIWDSNIDENAATTMPPSGVSEVGHAGGSYDGLNPYRGTYNAAESGPIDEEERKGYRHVWDFPTNKANGTIKCLSLTSKEGGNLGYYNSTVSTLAMNVPYTFAANYNGSTRIDANLKNVSMFRISSGFTSANFLYAEENEDGTATLLFLAAANNVGKVYEVTVKNPAERSFSSDVYTTATSKLLIDNIPLSNGTQYCTYYYNGYIYSQYASGNTLYAHVYDLTGAQVENHTITLPRTIDANGQKAIFYQNKYYYRVNNTDYYMTNVSGEDLGLGFSIYDYSGSSYGEVFGAAKVLQDGNLYFSYASSNYSSGVNDYPYCVILNPNGGYISTSLAGAVGGTTPSNIAKTAYIAKKSPFNYIGNVAGTSGEIYVTVDCRYLGTINNLASAVTKTEEQTMKVTYELVEA